MTWWLSLIGCYAALIVMVFAISFLFGNNPDQNHLSQFEDISTFGQIMAAIIALAIVWLSVCLQAKRWHDRDKSAWWMLIAIIPFIGDVWVLIECGFRRGTGGPNRFGDDPLGK